MSLKQQIKHKRERLAEEEIRKKSAEIHIEQLGLEIKQLLDDLCYAEYGIRKGDKLAVTDEFMTLVLERHPKERSYMKRFWGGLDHAEFLKLNDPAVAGYIVAGTAVLLSVPMDIIVRMRDAYLESL